MSLLCGCYYSCLRFLIACRFCITDAVILMTYAVISFLRSLTRYRSPGLSPASGFERPASTLPARFPAALGIGHGPACGLANACALVYVAA